MKFVLSLFNCAAVGSSIDDPNETIIDGPDTGKTHAMVWAERLLKNQRGLGDDDFLFVSRITAATLNHMIEEGERKGKSVVFWLAGSPEGRALLAHNDFALGSQITAATLNHIVEEGPNKGQSVAIWLVENPEGRALLAHGNPSLRSQITARTLNHVIEEGPNKGKSVAMLLAGTEEGRSLLESDNQALGRLIINRDKIISSFKEGPRYFEDPEILLEFIKKFPDRRDDIKEDAPDYVGQLEGFSKLRGTCKELNGFKLSQGEEKGIPDYLEKGQMMALCRLSLLASEEKKVQMTQVIEKRSDDDNGQIRGNMSLKKSE